MPFKKDTEMIPNGKDIYVDIEPRIHDDQSGDPLGDADYLQNKFGLKLFCRYWKPRSGNPQALVLLVHGFAEHLQWYDELGRRLADQGFLAFGHDHSGHGRSDGSRAFVESAEDYVDDVLLHMERVKKKYPSLPAYIVGHSMGGLVALCTVLRQPSIFRGMILVGPLITADAEHATTFRKMVARFLSKLWPQAQVAKLEVEQVTRDMEMRQKIINDPLRYKGGVKVAWAVAMMRAIDKMINNLKTIELPFLVIHGECDKLCDPKGSKLLHELSPSTDKELKIYPDARHHLYLETLDVRERALDETVNWITQRVQT